MSDRDTAGKVICHRLQMACHRCTAVTCLQTGYLQTPAQIEILAGKFQFGPAPANAVNHSCITVTCYLQPVADHLASGEMNGLGCDMSIINMY